MRLLLKNWRRHVIRGWIKEPEAREVDTVGRRETVEWRVSQSSFPTNMDCDGLLQWWDPCSSLTAFQPLSKAGVSGVKKCEKRHTRS